MSTRATIHFLQGGSAKPRAIVYRHGDGYPEPPGLGQDLQRFIAEPKANVSDTRFADASYLAAKWVVWDAKRQAEAGHGLDGTAAWKSKYYGEYHYLNFLSVGIMDADPGDIDYRYKVVCSGGYLQPEQQEPVITCETADGKPVAIPKLNTKEQTT